MQQYFIDKKIEVSNEIELDKDIMFHLTKVLRETNKSFRLVDINHDTYLCSLNNNKAIVKEKLNEYNELNIDVTCILSLIKQDKFELALQKLTELGVNKIVPFNASRSIVKETKPEKKLDRYKKIVTEAAEQSHRNIVPEITNAINLKDLKDYMSDINLIAYEKEEFNNIFELKAKSITFIIGPEGGFEPNEYETIKELGFKSISLGKRILRAETAAIYLASVIAGANL